MCEVQQVVTVGFAFRLGVLFVAVLFDLLRVACRSFVRVASCPCWRRSLVPGCQPKKSIEPKQPHPSQVTVMCRPLVSLTRAPCALIASIACSICCKPACPRSFGADKFAACAFLIRWPDAAIAFGQPTLGQPGNLTSGVCCDCAGRRNLRDCGQAHQEVIPVCVAGSGIMRGQFAVWNPRYRTNLMVGNSHPILAIEICMPPEGRRRHYRSQAVHF